MCYRVLFREDGGQNNDKLPYVINIMASQKLACEDNGEIRVPTKWLYNIYNICNLLLILSYSYTIHS